MVLMGVPSHTERAFRAGRISGLVEMIGKCVRVLREFSPSQADGPIMRGQPDPPATGPLLCLKHHAVTPKSRARFCIQKQQIALRSDSSQKSRARWTPTALPDLTSAMSSQLGEMGMDRLGDSPGSFAA